MSKLEEWHDNHSVSMIGYHIVWCTEYRKPVLKDGVDVIVKQTIAQTCTDNEWALRSIEVMPDHVHMFIQVHPADSPVNVVKTLKSTSAIAAFCTFPDLKGKKFWGCGLWSRGCYYGSVGQISQETVERYIEMQKKKGTP